MQPLPASLDISDDDWNNLSIDEAILADMEAGNFIRWEAMKRWMLSLNTDSPLPPPEVGD